MNKGTSQPFLPAEGCQSGAKAATIEGVAVAAFEKFELFEGNQNLLDYTPRALRRRLPTLPLS
jgi:hypothetical protein